MRTTAATRACRAGGQQLFFNNHGQKTTFTAERKSDVKARIDAGQATAQDAGALDDGAEMVLIIQVPLKHKVPEYRGGLGASGSGVGGGGMADGMMAMEMAVPSEAPTQKSAPRRAVSDVENAVIGHGEDLGPIAEGKKMKLERDERFPVRVTVQFYKATSNGVISDADLTMVKDQIDKVYAKGDYVGSLVVPEGARHRPTDWHLGKTPLASSSSPSTPSPSPTPATDSAADDGVARKTHEPDAWERFKAWLFD